MSKSARTTAAVVLTAVTAVSALAGLTVTAAPAAADGPTVSETVEARAGQVWRPR